jgi:hypothetical protein
MSSRWNDRGHVESGHGSLAPVDCAWSRPSHWWERVPRLGVPMAHRLARGLHMSLRWGGSELRGSGIFDDSTGARVRRRNVARGTHLARDLSARLRWDEVYCLCHKRLTCCHAFGESTLLGLLWWGFNDHIGCHISSSVGCPSILIPDSSPRACGGVEHSFRGLRMSNHG